MPRIFFCSAVAGASMRSYTGAPNSRVRSLYATPGSRPVNAVISAASKPGTMPSLSVVHTEPSRRRNDAPALSSPPNPIEPSSEAVDEPFEADRNLDQAASERRRHAIDHAAADDGLADRGILRPSLAMLEQVGNCYCQVMIRVHQSRARGRRCRGGRCQCRWRMRRRSDPSSRPAAPSHTGEEQSMRILPSQSTLMKRKVGSTASFTTVALMR